MDRAITSSGPLQDNAVNANKRRREGPEDEQQPSKRTAGEVSGYSKPTWQDEASKMLEKISRDPELQESLFHAHKKIQDAMKALAKASSTQPDPENPSKRHLSSGQVLPSLLNADLEAVGRGTYFDTALREISPDSPFSEVPPSVPESLQSEIAPGAITGLPKGFNAALDSIKRHLSDGLLEALKDDSELTRTRKILSKGGWDYDVMIRSRSLAQPCGGHVRAAKCYTMGAAAEAVIVAIERCQKCLSLGGTLGKRADGFPIWTGTDQDECYEMTVHIEPASPEV